MTNFYNLGECHRCKKILNKSDFIFPNHWRLGDCVREYYANEIGKIEPWRSYPNGLDGKEFYEIVKAHVKERGSISDFDIYYNC